MKAILAVTFVGLWAFGVNGLDICEDQINGARLAHPTDCSKYVVCQHQLTAYFSTCPTGLHFNRHIGECDLKSRAGCEAPKLRFSDATTSQEDFDCSCCCSCCGSSTPGLSTVTPDTTDADTTLTPGTTDDPGTSTPSTSTPGTTDDPGTSTPSTQTPGTTDDPDTPTPSTLTPGTTDDPGTETPSTLTPGTTDDPGTSTPSTQTPGTTDDPGTQTPSTLTPGTTDDPGTSTPSTQTPGSTDDPDTPTPSTLTPGTTDDPGTQTPSTLTPGTTDDPGTSTPSTQTPGTTDDPGTSTSSTPTPGTTDDPDTPTPSISTPGTPTSETTTSIPNIPGCTNNLTVCRGQPDGSHQLYPNDCRQFVVCVDGCSVPMNCPSNLQYSLSAGACVYPEESDCPWETAPPNGAAAGPSGVACHNPGQCANRSNGETFADPLSTGYIVCQCQCEIPMPCAAGTAFNEEKSVCDWPANIQNNTSYWVECPEGLVFNATIGVCDWPLNF